MKILNMTLHKLKPIKEFEYEIVETTIEDKKSLLIDFNNLKDEKYMKEIIKLIAEVIKKHDDAIDTVYVAGAAPVVLATVIVAEIYGIIPVGGIINDKKEVIDVYPLPTYSSIPREFRMELEHL